MQKNTNKRDIFVLTSLEGRKIKSAYIYSRGIIKKFCISRGATLKLAL